MIISVRDPLPGEISQKILQGKVTLTLVNKEGELMDNKNNELMETSDNIYTKFLDSQSLNAAFSIKILETSGGNMFRLKFQIEYELENKENRREELISRPFLVYSNKKKNGKETPIVFGMKPIVGNSHEETEIWIKGSSFADSVFVTFGGIKAKITDREDNLLTVIAPIRNNLQKEELVDVVITNIYGSHLLEADKKLYFKYQTNIK